MTPYAAPTLSRFMMTALSGSTSERNTTMRRRNERIRTAPITTKRRWPRKLAASMLAAVCPPTCASTLVPATTGGMTSLRSVWTSASVWDDCGEVVG